MSGHPADNTGTSSGLTHPSASDPQALADALTEPHWTMLGLLQHLERRVALLELAVVLDSAALVAVAGVAFHVW